MVTRTVNPRKQGDAGLGISIGYYAERGYTVCVPLTDSQDYDLVVDLAKEGLRRVQVKTATSLSRCGRYYEVDLRSRGGNRSGTGKTKFLDTATADDLFVVTGSNELFVIPVATVQGKTKVQLGPRQLKYRMGVWHSGNCA